MSNPPVTIVDYGMCNLLNVARAFEHCGAAVTVTENPADVAAAQRLVVPGVGAFRDSMAEIMQRGFADPIRRFAESGRPMYGICVGMQVLFEGSEEFGDHEGRAMLPGRVKAVPSRDVDGAPQRVPHIGWNHLTRPQTGRDWRGTLLDPVADSEPAVYFVHSFAAVPADDSDRLADARYGGHRICAAIQRGNLIASQFHPEKSGEVGLALLRRFLAL
jgi:glutamine amidotransferase